MAKPEQAVFLHTRSQLLAFRNTGFSRIYFGSEVCSLLLPIESDIELLEKVARRAALDFTIVTPHMAEAQTAVLERILGYLYKNFPSLEIVVNDWGTINLILEKFPGFNMILGRILNRQRRGLFLRTEGSKINSVYFHHSMSKEDLAYLKASVVQNQRIVDFLCSINIKRIGLDNLQQGIILDKVEKIKIDLYYPYCYLTSSPYCLTRALSNRPPIYKKTDSCHKICLSQPIKKIKMARDNIYLKENGQYYLNSKIFPSVLKKIDRLVTELL